MVVCYNVWFGIVGLFGDCDFVVCCICLLCLFVDFVLMI